MSQFFAPPPKLNPTIYAYEFVNVPSHQGYLKIGYTEREPEVRIKEQLHTSAVSYRIVFQTSAMRADGSCFTDHEVHSVLKKNGFSQLNAGKDKNEWFKCDIDSLKAAIIAVREGRNYIKNRFQCFKMRPEQTRAVQKTEEYFDEHKKRTLIELLSFFGMPKCDLEKHLPHIN